MLLALILSACVNVEVPPVPTTGNSVKEAEMKDGVQTVTLSWGRLNYAPEVIKLKQGIPAKIIADTTRLTGCYRVLEVPQLKLEKHFSEKDNELDFTPTKAGTYPFGCAMGMGRGTLIVE